VTLTLLWTVCTTDIQQQWPTAVVCNRKYDSNAFNRNRDKRITV